MIYLIFFVTIIGYTFVIKVSGLSYGALFYFMIFFPAILPLLVETDKYRKPSFKSNLKVLLLIFISAVMGMLFFHWLL